MITKRAIINAEVMKSTMKFAELKEMRNLQIAKIWKGMTSNRTIVDADSTKVQFFDYKNIGKDNFSSDYDTYHLTVCK